jgi:hypothetical protein
MMIATASSLLDRSTQEQIRAAVEAGTTVTVTAAKPDEVPGFLSYLDTPHGSSALATYTAQYGKTPLIKWDPASEQLISHAVNEALKRAHPATAAQFTPEMRLAIGLGSGAMIGAGLGAMVSLARAAEPTGAAASLLTVVAVAMGIGGTIGGGIGLGMAGGVIGKVNVPTPLGAFE